jgi:hypothetical protein
MLIWKTPGDDVGNISKFGVSAAKSPNFLIRASSISVAVKAVIDSGTLMRLSERRRDVTTTSSSAGDAPSRLVAWADASEAAALETTGKSTRQIWRVVLRAMMEDMCFK